MRTCRSFVLCDCAPVDPPTCFAPERSQKEQRDDGRPYLSDEIDSEGIETWSLEEKEKTNVLFQVFFFFLPMHEVDICLSRHPEIGTCQR